MQALDPRKDRNTALGTLYWLLANAEQTAKDRVREADYARIQAEAFEHCASTIRQQIEQLEAKIKAHPNA